MTTCLLKLLDEPTLRVLDFLIDNIAFDHTITDIAKGAGLSRTTVYKVFEKLKKLDMVVRTKEFGRAKYYKLNKDNPIVRKLIELDEVVSEVVG